MIKQTVRVRDYVRQALAACAAAGLTADQVAGHGYTDMLRLGGLPTPANGSSPADYHWLAVRDQVVAALRAAELDTARTRVITLIGGDEPLGDYEVLLDARQHLELRRRGGRT